MPNKKRESANQTSVRAGNISDVSGTVNIAGGNITTHQTTTGLSAAEIKQLFELVYTAIDARSKTSLVDKADLKSTVQEVEYVVTEAAKKNEKRTYEVGEVSGTWVLGRPPAAVPSLLVHVMMDDAAAPLKA